MGTGEVTASVVSHGHGPVLAGLLDDLVRTAPPALKRVVVTLNVPEPEPLAGAALPFDLVVVRNDRPLGFGANHNRAFRQYCSTAWFAVLNPDLRWQADPFVPLIQAAAPADALLAPQILEIDGRTADSIRHLPTPLALAQRALGRRAPAGRDAFDWLAGMFLVLRSEAFRSLGGFDERYFLYCEDIDLSLRVRLSGLALRYVESVQVVHDAQRQSRRSARHLRWHLESLARFWMSPSFWRYLAARLK